MKKLLLLILVMFLSFGSFAKNNFDKVNTVYTNTPVRIIFKQDSIFSVSINKNYEKYVQYEVINDTILKISHKGFWYETNEETPIIKIKTPKILNVECSRDLKKSTIK